MIDKELQHKIKFGGCVTILFLVGFSLANLLINNNIPFIFAIGITLILLIFGIVAFLIVTGTDETEQNNEFELYDKDSEILFED